MADFTLNDTWQYAGDQSLAAQYNGGVTILKNQFEVGAENYHMTITIETDAGTVKGTYTIPNPNGNMVSLYIHGTAWLGYDVLFSDDYTRINSEFSFEWSNNLNINDIQLVNSGSAQDVSIGCSKNGIGGTVSATDNVHYPYPKRRSCDITIDADFPVFADFGVNTGSNDPSGFIYIASYSNVKADINNNYATYKNEVGAGTYTHVPLACNYYSITNEIPVNKVWSVRCMLKRNGSVVSGTNKAYDFRILPDARIWFVLTNRLHGDDTANMILHINESPWLQKIAYAPDSTYAETSSLDNTYWFGNWTDYDNGDAYTGVCSTNIPIFDSDEKGDAYGRGEIGTDEALNGGDTSFSRSTIGDDLSASDIPTVNLAVSGCGSYIYALSSSDLKDVMSNYVYTTDATLQGNIQGGLWLWGNNPADFIIDLYYIPFAITNFYDTINANLKFGTYQIPDTSYSAVKEANGDRITLFNTTFEGIYGDWRDFTQFDYELFLPFKGFVTLDVYKILNRTVRCEMMFDITTHNIRYYLFADDVIIERYDASVGVNMPIMASDMVNKAKAEHEATLGAVKSGANALGGIIGNGAKLFAGDVVGGTTGLIQTGTNAVIDGIKTYDTFASHESQSVQGSFSSAMNIYDITYAYIKITERGLIIPDKLHTLYNYPSYYMGKASALSGYCEISDIRLNGFTGTKDEAIALKNDLKEGVIL